MNDHGIAPPARLVKFIRVRRSNRVPTAYWWSLPLGLPRFGALYAEALAGARMLVRPASALGDHARELGAEPSAGGAASLHDVPRFLALRGEGRVGPCTAALFPATVSEAEIAARSFDRRTELERLPFTIAIVPCGDGRARHEYCFRVPGKVIAALEDLALGRRFGGDPGRLEMAMLHGLGLRPGQSAELRLEMESGGACLVRIEAGGRRRLTLLQSGKGYTGTRESLSLGAALRERWRESWRRFPVGVVMFVGLPLFIATFWIAGLFRRGTMPARDTEAPPEA